MSPSRRSVTHALTTLLIVLGLTASAPAAEKYALLVGIRSYSEAKELRPLPYAEADVTELAAALRDAGFRADNVVLMTQKAGADDLRFLPVRDRIRKELRLLLKNRVANDTVLVAFAGHGVQFKGDPVSFFCPADAQLDDKSTLVSFDEVSRELEQCQAGAKLFLVDACRNDPFADKSRAATRELESVTQPPMPKQATGLAAFFSCRATEKAFEHDELKHGVFFHFIIAGLRGEAANPAGDVTLLGLADFVTTRTADFVRAKYATDQRPALHANDLGGTVLVNGLGAVRALNRGKEFLKRYDFGAAIAEFTAALRTNPKLAAAYRQRGEAFDSLYRYERALEDYDEAVRLNPDDPETLILRGRAHLALRNEARGRSDLNAAVTLLKPADAAAYNLRAIAFKALNNRRHADSERAIADATEAIRLDPKYARAYRTRGSLFVDQRDYAKAIRDGDEAIRLDSKDAAAYVMRGNAYFYLNDAARAARDFADALRLNPKNADAILGRGDLALDRLDFTSALRDYDEVIRLDPNDSTAFVHRGALYRQSRDIARAVRDFDEAIRLDPTDATAFNNRGNAYFDQRDFVRAMRDYGEAIRLDPKYGAPYNNRGNVHHEQGDFAQAIRDYDQAIRLNPNDADAYRNRGNSYQALGNTARADADFAKARALESRK